MNNNKQTLEHLHNALFYHNYKSPNNNNIKIELVKGEYYDILPHNDLNTNNKRGNPNRNNSTFMFHNVMFLGCPEKKILRYMPEIGKLEARHSKMCHFLMKNNNSSDLMEINADHIKKASLSQIHSGGNKTSRKNLKGGEESWGATGMPAQFYNPNKPLTSYPPNSGFGVPTAYGASLPLDVGTGLLAPFTASKAKTANLATMTKTGGTKKNSNTKKTPKTQTDKKTPSKKKSKKSSCNIKAKMMKGGEESWGATGMPAQFYNAKKPLMSYPPNSGFGVQTAYGASLPLDVGTGLLAPFTASKSKTANMATMNKTGGAKKKSPTKKQTTKTQKDKKPKKKSPTKKPTKKACKM